MSAVATAESMLNDSQAARADFLFGASRLANYRRIDRLFAGLMCFQWLAGVVAALVISPHAWAGTAVHVHMHVWAAIFLGGAITVFPVLLATLRPGEAMTRYTIAVAQMLITIGTAEVLISLPKLKTHKKVGVTLSLKNLVGINGDKNYLPHFCIGTPDEGGDEFPDSKAATKFQSRAIAAFKSVAKRSGAATKLWAPLAKRVGSRVFGDTTKVVRSGNWWGSTSKVTSRRIMRCCMPTGRASARSAAANSARAEHVRGRTRREFLRIEPQHL